jgi:hypothetical protein
METPLTPDALRAQFPLDEHGRLNIDVPYTRCGYNLRSADPDGRCPECGLSVGRSTLGDRLRFRDPKWAQNIYWGMNRFAVAVVTSLFTIGLLSLAG